MKVNIKNKFVVSFLYFLLLVIFIANFPINAETTIPSPTNYKYINDYSKSIDQTEANRIVSIGKELEDKTGAQAVIVVINSTNKTPIEDYAINLFRTWGIGQKGKDNGLLILLAIEDRTWRVEVGRGLEGAIPDVLSNRVMETIAKPSFIVGKYGEGLQNAYSTFCDYIAKEYNVTLDKSLNITLPAADSVASNTNVKIIGGTILCLLILDFIFNRGRISYSLLQIILWSSFFRGNGPRGGSSGGGFGGFGGGTSGGGGSSGNW